MGAWMIRAGRGGAYAADWLERGIIGIGWDFGGADIATMDREKIRAAYTAAHPSESKQKVAANVGQVYSSNASSNSPKCPNKKRLRSRYAVNDGPGNDL